MIKYISALFALAATIVTSIVGGLEWADIRQGDKIAAAKNEIRHEMAFYRKERNDKINLIDVKLVTEIGNMKTSISEINKNVRTLIRRSNRDLVLNNKITNEIQKLNKKI